MNSRTDGSDSNAVAERVAKVHAACSEQLLRLAWAIVRDWGLAADAVQETFVVFAEKYDTIEEGFHRGWLIKTVQFQALNLRRSQQRSSKLLDRLHEQVGEQPSTYATNRSEADPEHDEQIEQLRKAIDALPPEQRQIVQRRMADEQGFAEIAEQLNLPLGTVLSRMRLAIEKLRRKLTSDER